MDPLSATISSIGLVSLVRQAIGSVQQGREVEEFKRLILSYRTEVLIYKDYSNILLAQTDLHSSLTVEDCHKENWTNPSVREAFEARFGVEKGNHLLTVLRSCLNGIELTGVFMSVLDYADSSLEYENIEHWLSVESPQISELSYSLISAAETQKSILLFVQQCVTRITNTNKNIWRLLRSDTFTAGQITAGPSTALPWLSPHSHPPTLPSNTYPIYLDDTNTTGAILDLEAQDQDQYQDQELALTLSARASTARRLQIDQLPPRLSAWRILMQSENSSYFCVQFSVLVLAVTITIVWSIMKGDLGTGTGLGGMVFGVGSTLSNVYERFFKRRKQKRGNKKEDVPPRLLE